MEKILVVLIGCFLFFGAVFVNADFGDINTAGENTSTEGSLVKIQDEVLPDSFKPTGSRNSGIAKTIHTKYFYLALGLGGLVLLIVIYIIYRFVVGPKVRWKKPKPVKL